MYQPLEADSSYISWIPILAWDELFYRGACLFGRYRESPYKLNHVLNFQKAVRLIHCPSLCVPFNIVTEFTAGNSKYLVCLKVLKLRLLVFFPAFTGLPWWMVCINPLHHSARRLSKLLNRHYSWDMRRRKRWSRSRLCMWISFSSAETTACDIIKLSAK